MGQTRDLWVYASVGHRFVEGWVEPQVFPILRALQLEQQRLGVRGGSAEIGVHHGRLFIALHLLRQSGTRSVAVDVFSEQHLNLDKSGYGDESMFRTNVDRWSDASGVEIICEDSTTIDGQRVRDRAGGTVRMFSVDGGHTSDVVQHDMHTSEQAITPGGIVIADDVFNGQWPGVYEGTLRYLQTGGLVPFAIGFNKVLFTNPSHASSYRKLLEDVAVRHLWLHKESAMAGHPVRIMWLASPKQRLRKLAKRVIRA